MMRAKKTIGHPSVIKARGQIVNPDLDASLAAFVKTMSA